MLFFLTSLQVASIVGRAEVLSCIFFLLSILSYCKAVSKGQGPALSPLPHTKWSYVLISIFLCVCAMLSKEQGIVSLGVCATFDIVLHWKVFWEGLLSFLKAKPCGAPEVRGEGTGQVLLKEKLSIGGVIEEERNGFNGSIGDTVNGKHSKVVKRNRERSGNHLVISALAKRLGNVLPYKNVICFSCCCCLIGLLVVSGLALMWFRLSMNYHSQPIFKVEELNAAFHPNRSVRY